MGRVKEYDTSPSALEFKINKVIKTLNRLPQLMYLGKIDEAEKVVNGCIKDIENVCRYSLQGYGKREEALAKIRYYKDVISYTREAINMRQEKQVVYIDGIKDDKMKSMVKTVVINSIAFREIEEQMAENEMYVKAVNRDKLRQGILRCKSLRKKIKGVENKKNMFKSDLERLQAEMDIITWEKSELRNYNK